VIGPGVPGVVPDEPTVAFAVEVHPSAVVTVTVYVPAARLVAVCVVCTGEVFHEYEYGVAPPEGFAVAVPVLDEQPEAVVVVVTVAATFGTALPLPAGLVQPFTVCVTVRIPEVVTVMEGVVAPVLHNNVPDAEVARVDVPQLFATVTAGTPGDTFGAALAEAWALMHPLTVCFTV